MREIRQFVTDVIRKSERIFPIIYKMQRKLYSDTLKTRNQYFMQFT